MALSGELERDVMARLWAAQEPLTVRQVHDRLRLERDLAYTTVMTVLDRLYKKGLVEREEIDRAFRYSPTQTREELTANTMLDALYESPDVEGALLHFIGRVARVHEPTLREALQTLDGDRKPER